MILVVGLSSAWQRTSFFNDYVHGGVNRASHVLESAAGKGVNVARTATILGAPNCLLTVAGGTRGRLLRNALAFSGVKARIIPMAKETRLCQTIIAGNRVTELIEDAPSLSPEDVQAIYSEYSKLIRRASLVVLSGTVPRGCGDFFYTRLAKEAGQWGLPVLADTQGLQLLHLAEERPLLLKINRAELSAATGISDIAGGVRKLMKRGARRVVISNGTKATVVFDGSSSWPVMPPRIKAVNPIGSGDAMLAGLAVGLHRRQTLESAVELGLACGAANALTATPGVIRMADVKEQLTRISCAHSAACNVPPSGIPGGQIHRHGV
ncbi:MAG: PfkB family carbohydrate kinase [bacterium]